MTIEQGQPADSSLVAEGAAATRTMRLPEQRAEPASSHQRLVNFIWQVADLLRGDYKQSEYGKVILPFTVLRRLDCVLEPTKQDVLAANEKWRNSGIGNIDSLLRKAARRSFYNKSKLDFATLMRDQDNIAKNFKAYLGGFSQNAREVLDCYQIETQLDRLNSADLLYLVTGKFAEMDLSPQAVSNHQMGYVFEELIRKFSELSNETAGEHFTPREVIKLMVSLLLAPDAAVLADPGTNRTVFDPACGTGGMLSAAEELIREFNPHATVTVFGQELNEESYAICRSDMMIKGDNPRLDYGQNIRLGNSFSHDRHYGKRFDYLLANPPFGVEWKKVRDDVEQEHRQRGFGGRFGAGLPRINDGSLLFLQHMIDKMNRPEDGGSRLAIVFNGSPLFTGAAESGESNIRRWILEHDWLEAIVALPDQLFYNTGISTYFWILSNRKDAEHQGKVILLDARDYWIKMRKSLGDKRKQISDEQIRELTELYDAALSVAADPEHPLHGKVKVFDNRDFGYQRITVERPLKLRFEVTEDALAELELAKPLAKYEARDQLIAALRPLIGQPASWKKVEFVGRLQAACAAVGLSKLPAGVEKAVWNAVSVADPEGEKQYDRKGNVEPDPDLRDYENVPLDEDIHAYLKREVLPYVPDAWIDETKTKIGYEIPFTRHFYVYKPPRPLAEIDAELKELEGQIQTLLREVTE